MEYGTDAQKERFLKPMAAGDEIWAQAWSEPGAGSDMAAIRSKAVRDGDEYVISGQKNLVITRCICRLVFWPVQNRP